MCLLVLVSGLVFAEGQGEAAKAKAKVSIYWALYEGMRDVFRSDLQAAFNKQYPNYDLEIVPVDWDKLHDKLTTAMAAGKPPEASIIGTRWLLEFMDMDAVVEVSPYVSKATLDNIAPGAMEAKLKGVLMGLPFAAGVRFLAINESLSTVVPKTMEELRDAAIKATSKDKYGLIMVGGKHTELTDFCYYFYSAGGNYFEINADGSFGKSTVNSPAGIKALTFMVDLANKDKVVQDGYISQDRHASHPVFFSGKAAYCMIGAWADTSYKDAKATWPIKYGQIPPFEGQKPAPLIITDSIAIFKAAKNKEGIGKFLDLLYKDEWKAVLDKDIGFPPVTKSAATRPEFNTPMYKAMAEGNLNAKGWPLVVEWAECTDIIWDAVQKAYLGKMSPKAALDEAAAKMDAARKLK
jgi:multiple sugar transport system substrate-binding protein